MVNFQTNSKDLISVLKKMQLAFKGQSTKARKKAVCEITVKSHFIELVVTGIQYQVPAKSSGAAKIVVQFFPFFKLLESFPEKSIEFKVSSGMVETESFSFPARTIFFEDDKVLRSIVLPINYNDTDLLQLLVKGYTKEELEFNRISPAIEKARIELELNIQNAFDNLKQYGVTEAELKEIVSKRLGVDLFK